MDAAAAIKALESGIPCAKWLSIFKQNLDMSGDSPKWKFNVEDLSANTKKHQQHLSTSSPLFFSSWFLFRVVILAHDRILPVA